MSMDQDLIFLGLDIGRIHTRATLFGLLEGRYRLLGQGIAQTSLGAGRHLGEGVSEAIKALEKQCSRKLLNHNGSPIRPVRANGSGLDKIALTVSAGPEMRTIVTGLTESRSLRAGRALTGSLPLDLAGLFGLSELRQESNLVDRMVDLQPELIVMTGGDSSGAVEPLEAWIEAVRLVSMLLPKGSKPQVLYAGNPVFWELAKRRLEPFAPLHLAANLLPTVNHLDLLPAQTILNRLIVNYWKEVLPGLRELAALAEDQVVCGQYGLNRMVRFLSRPMGSGGENARPRGVMAVNLGGGSDSMVIGLDGECLSVRQAAPSLRRGYDHESEVAEIHHWMPEEIDRESVSHYCHRRELNPNVVPAVPMELAFEQALVRSRLQMAGLQAFRDYQDAPFNPETGWLGHFEPIIAAGEVFNRAPLPGQVMLMLLDGIQPRGVTTLVLDRYQILPTLGVIAESFPILPIHLLETGAFQNLGTVITTTGAVPEGEKVLTLQVIKESGADFSVDVQQGMLRRVVIQMDEPVVLVLKPEKDVDVGFGEPGLGGRLKVMGGALGVLVDARGRPIPVPHDPAERIARLQRWGWTLGAGER